MLFDRIRLSGPTNVDFPLVGVQSTDPYLIKDSDGLGPSEVDVHIKRTLNRGGIAQAIRPRNKSIDLLVKLNPNHQLSQTPSDLREAVYAFLTPVMNKPIKVQLMNGANIVCEIEGFVSRVTPNPFSKDPEIQISIPCLQPYFTATAPINMGFNDGYAPAPGFTFNLPVVRGSAPTPFAISVKFPSTVFSFRMYHAGNSAEGKAFSLPVQMNAGTTLVIGGTPGAKVVRHDIPSQLSVDRIGQLATNSVWIELYPGANTLVFDSNVEIMSVDYTPKFQGV